MKRVLTFGDDAKSAKRFEMCLTALLQAGDGKQDRTRAVVRQEARILDAFDAVSVEIAAQDRKPASLERELKPEGGSITLRQDDLALLAKYLDTTPWMPRVSREAVDAQDFVDAAEKIEE